MARVRNTSCKRIRISNRRVRGTYASCCNPTPAYQCVWCGAGQVQSTLQLTLSLSDESVVGSTCVNPDFTIYWSLLNGSWLLAQGGLFFPCNYGLSSPAGANTSMQITISFGTVSVVVGTTSDSGGGVSTVCNVPVFANGSVSGLGGQFDCRGPFSGDIISGAVAPDTVIGSFSID